MKEYQKGIFINCNAYTDLFNTGYFKLGSSFF